MYKRNIEARSCNHCCSIKAVIVVYCESVVVAVDIQHAMRTKHVVICGVSASTVFLHIISQTARFSQLPV